MTLTVLIIGAGPVGLSLATALAKAKIPCHIFEKGKSIVPEIRASTFHPATMEKMAEWGILDKVLAEGHKVQRLQFWDRSSRSIVGDFDYSLIAHDTAFPFRLQCPQHLYAEALLDALKDHPLVNVSFEHEFLGFEEDSKTVKALFATPEGTREYTGVLLCGADGSSSALRQKLNLEFAGMTYEDRFLLVGTDIDLQKYYPEMAPVSYIFDPEEWVITLRLNGLLRLVFQVQSSEALPQDKSSHDRSLDHELTDQRIRERVLKFIGEKVEFPILHRSIYRVHQRVASTFRQGKCLLLGDAAHINNPASGLGMNSGILDAALLSEMIRLYLETGSEHWLNVYSENRRQYALENIRTYTKQRYGDLSAKNPEDRAIRNKTYLEESQSPAKARAFLLKASMLETRI